MAGLSAFLPWNLYDLVGEALSGRPAWKRMEGTVLFCDVAGFTPLTEALSVLGKEGSEELTRLLNAYFACMIGITEEKGGRRHAVWRGRDQSPLSGPRRRKSAPLRVQDDGSHGKVLQPADKSRGLQPLHENRRGPWLRSARIRR